MCRGGHVCIRDLVSTLFGVTTRTCALKGPHCYLSGLWLILPWLFLPSPLLPLVSVLVLTLGSLSLTPAHGLLIRS